MNCGPIFTFIIFRSHLMEVERNQFSLLLRETYSCLSLWFDLEVVRMGGGSPLSVWLSISLSLSLSQSRLNLWTFSILLFFPCSFFIATSPSVRLSRCISADLNEDSQHFSLPANTLSKRKSRSGKSIFFHIIKSSSAAAACVVPSARSPSEGLNPERPRHSRRTHRGIWYG